LVAWNIGGTSNTLDDLCAATYVVTVTNENNCSGISSFVVGQADPILLTIDTIVNYSAVALGSVVVSMSGVGLGYTCECHAITGTCGICDESSLTSTTLEGLSVGCYQLTITNPNGCAATTDTFCIQEMPTSVSDVYFESVQIYPNPANDVLHIKYIEGKIPEEIVLKNVFGSAIARYSFTSSIDVSTLQSGMYFITIYDENHTITKTITIQR